MATIAVSVVTQTTTVFDGEADGCMDEEAMVVVVEESTKRTTPPVPPIHEDPLWTVMPSLTTGVVEEDVKWAVDEEVLSEALLSEAHRLAILSKVAAKPH